MKKARGKLIGIENIADFTRVKWDISTPLPPWQGGSVKLIQSGTGG